MLRFVFVSILLVPIFALAQSGTGLTGQYYDTATFGTLKTTRTDTAVNFSFGTAIPSGTAITNADTFSIAWSGQIEPEFSGLYTFYVSADDGARLWVNDQMIASRTFFTTPTEMRGQVNLEAGKRVNIRLEYIEQTGGASVKLEWSCASRAREVIPTSRLYPARMDKVGGSVLKEHWSGIAGGAISSVTSNANYPSKPGGREFITSFECLAQDWADSYGTRVTGFIVPPVTGSYTFAVSGDDVVELYVSTDATSANKSLAASVASPTAFRAWGTPSTARTLTQGVRYYVELLHKENTGTDHWSVGWKKPGDSVFSLIPGSALVQPGLTTAQPTEANLLNTMAQDHPRLFATAERFAKLKAAYLSPTASQQKTWAQNAINSANTILTQAPVVYAPDVRSVILTQSRSVVDRMYKLGVAYWMTSDPQYAERAWTELNTVADNTLFPNWNPSHFLDTAEMTHACAIGYDWFYHYWDTSRRSTIRNAIINKGLTPGLSQFTSNAGWSQSDGNNWNQVCTGGLTMGALVVGTESEALVENILNRSINSTRPCWKHFTTDNGAWYEGPGYWGYTTEYGMRMLAGLEWVLGSDFGISNTRNVSEAGYGPMNSLGTSNVIFNYADAGAGGGTRGAQFQWMARRYGIAAYDGWENTGSGSALSALWWNDHAGVTVANNGSAPDMAFHGDAGTAFQPQEMVTMRGKWADSRATFVGTKGGQMGADHGNLDAGTFVLDALGKRWFHDLGGDNYALTNYFNGTPNASGVDRWDYYRMRPEGQNTLAINPDGTAGMVLNAVAPLTAYQSEPGGSGSFSIHDLTPVYSGMSKVWRGVRMMGARDEVLVQDEIQAATGKTVWWFAHYTHPTTSVVIDPDGTSAMLTQGAERLWCKIVSGGTFQIRDAVPLPGSANPITTPAQNANTGHKKLAINLTNVTNTTLAVWFVPLQTADSIPTTLPTITALNTWNIAASNDAPVAVNGVATSNGENPVDIDLRSYITDDSTPSAQMLFTVANPQNGTVTLLADGYTARFTPTPGYTGVPSFTFTATDAGGNADTMLVWDFDLPDGTATNVAVDASGKGRDGTIDFAAAGTYSLVTDKPAALAQQGARSIDVVEDGTNGTRVQRSFTAAELDWNVADWSVAGWFKRRDTTNDDIMWHISDGDGFGSNDELYLNCPAGATTVRLQHFNAAGAALDVDIAKTGITAGGWHHFAVVRSGTSISLYIDGTLVGTDSAFALALNQTSPLVFGGHASTTFAQQRWFDGGLDDLMVSKAVLDATQIASLANGATARHFGGLSTTATISLSAAPVNYVWTSTTSGNWSTGTNWQSGAAPTGTRGASVQFYIGQTLAGVTATATNDIAGVFQMNNLTLAGTNGTGATTATISGGTFQLLNNGTTLPTVNLTGTSGSGTNILTYNINTPVVLGADTTFNASNSGTFIFNSDVSGAGGVIRNSTSSKLVLAGTNSYTGDTTINAGTLQIGNDAATGTLGTGDVINNGTLRFDRTGTLTVPNAITGTGGVQIDCPINAGTVVFSGTNTFDGGVNVSGGTLRITNSTALGDGTKTVSLSNGTAGAPHLNLDGSSDPIELPATISYNTSSNAGAIVNEAGDNTILGSISPTGGGGDTKILVNGGTLTLAGAIAPIATGRNLLLDGAGAGIVTSVISNGSGANVLLSVNKQGAGTWTLSGANSHGGTTTVTAGTLAIGHANALGSGGLQFGNTAGATSITAGAVLDLNGQQNVNEAITVRGTGISSGGALVNNSTTPASIVAGMVASISTTAGGVHSAVPDVILSGNATAVATLGLSAASFTINGGTTEYSAAPTVTITGGGGSGATATAVLTSGVVTGITITNTGTGYTTSPTISFSGGTITTAGTNPTGSGNASNFVVAGIQVTNPGSGYTSAPGVTFSSGTGTTATANLSSIILGANSNIGGSGDIGIQPGISGAFTLSKVGTGTLMLHGANTHGTTSINGGRLALTGSLAGAVSTSNGCTFAPQGTPTVTGALTHFSSSVLQVRLNGSTAGTGYDQLNAGGNVTLAGTLDLVCGPSLAPGSVFTILNKTSTGAISGTFAGKANNSTFTDDGYTFQITYTGGTGNDIVLTLIATPIEQWRFTNFGSMLNTGAGLDTLDGDSDGSANLLEYATKMNPALNDVVPQSAAKNGSMIDFIYTKNKSATDVTFIVEWSDTLGNDWSTSGVTQALVPGSDNGVTQQWKAVMPAGATRRFVRLRVTRP